MSHMCHLHIYEIASTRSLSKGKDDGTKMREKSKDLRISQNLDYASHQSE